MYRDRKTWQTWKMKPHFIVQSSRKCIKTPKTDDGERPFLSAPQEGTLPALAKRWEYPPVTSAASCRIWECCGGIKERSQTDEPHPCAGPLAESVTPRLCKVSPSQLWSPAAWCSARIFWRGRRIVDLDRLVGGAGFSLGWVALRWTRHPAGSCPSSLAVASELISVDSLV